ncbi:hypothetical protein CEXT_457431 [Caerostris extrusa]|uniref:Uncharacterized protein n=1 Tax=Caerostris extrusa TaxID=172846 RepID=A0AAV4VJV4_CAEEX|nr:hypothetical protein CEXT_457431 [Caerostris extrusa]
MIHQTPETIRTIDLDHLSTCPMNPASRGRHALPEEWAIEDYLEKTIFSRESGHDTKTCRNLKGKGCARY